MANLIFLGTPQFACPVLKAVGEFCKMNHHRLLFVVSQPDKPKGRGNKIEPTPVKALASELGLPVYQPATLRKDSEEGQAFFQLMAEQDIDVAVVVAYGKIIPARFLALPKRGFVNVHGSLLPRFRGAAPIQRAVLEGDKETGVSIMDLVPEMDAGPVYEKVSLSILPEDDSQTLFQKLSDLGAQTLVKCLPGIIEGALPKEPQPQEGVTYAPPLRKEEGKISFDEESSSIMNRVRAMQPWPSAYGFLNGKLVKFYSPYGSSEKLLAVDSVRPGTVLSLQGGVAVRTQDGSLGFKQIQIEGKRPMTAQEASNGGWVKLGDVFH